MSAKEGRRAQGKPAKERAVLLSFLVFGISCFAPHYEDFLCIWYFPGCIAFCRVVEASYMLGALSGAAASRVEVSWAFGASWGMLLGVVEAFRSWYSFFRCPPCICTILQHSPNSFMACADLPGPFPTP